jgi:alpha-tubulin suppressor-like RCC1 family protein
MTCRVVSVVVTMGLACGGHDDADVGVSDCDACLDAAAPDAGGPVDARLDERADGGADGGGTPFLEDVRVVAAGAAHTCVVTGEDASRRVLCWGDDQFGQVGRGVRGLEPVTRPSPVEPLVGEPVDELALGATHSCARLSSGELRCWGGNTRGQIGTGAPSLWVPAPTRVPGVDAVTVAAGGAHTCVTRAAADALCWGAGEDGQLGGGAMSDSPLPVVSTVAPRPLAIDGGDFHTCALHGTGVVDCVGRDDVGQLGYGPASPPIPDVVALATGQSHTCAVRASGEVWCWGANEDGQLGDGTTTESPDRRRVEGLPAPAREIHADTDHSCAVLANDDLWCWGENEDGQSIPGGTTDQRTPAFTGLGGVDAVAVGRLHVCVLDGPELRCFGDNVRGQLGDGTTEPRAGPVRVVSP